MSYWGNLLKTRVGSFVPLVGSIPFSTPKMEDTIVDILIIDTGDNVASAYAKHESLKRVFIDRPYSAWLDYVKSGDVLKDVKYALQPGWVESKTDGDRHYIDAPTLARLYGVRMEECVVDASSDRRRGVDTSADVSWRAGLIKLYPRYDGDYKIPEDKKCSGEI